MVSSTLELISGKLPSNAPFDLQDSADLSRLSLWTPSLTGIKRGDLWIDYPFPESYSALNINQSDPEHARNIKTRIANHIDTIVAEASAVGLSEGRIRWTLDELLANATQYGAISESHEAAVLIRLEWLIDDGGSSPTFSIAISNPCYELFDPSRFARMTIDEFYSLSDSGTNGHLAILSLISLAHEGTKLSYLWELKDGARIRLSISKIDEADPARPVNYDELMKPVSLEVEKFDADGHLVPYSLVDFEADVSKRSKTESVSVSCVISNPRPDEPTT